MIFRFLEMHNVLYSLQFGFQQNHSIDYTLVSLTEAVRDALDSKRFGCGIFIDLQKAFYTVNLSILLLELEHYGVPGYALDWFNSYLFDRKQYVSINGKNSNLYTVCWVYHKALYWALYFFLYI